MLAVLQVVGSANGIASLGDYPYNYGTAFGQNNLTMPAPLPSTAGALSIQEQMLIEITAMD